MREMQELGAAERDKKIASDQPLLPFNNKKWLEEIIEQGQRAKASVRPGEQIPLFFDMGGVSPAPMASASAAYAGYAAPPITVGMAIRDLGDAVMTVGSTAIHAGMEKASELSQNPRVRAIAQVAGGVAYSMGVSMISNMALRFAISATATAIMPAAAPFVVPTILAGISIYKIGKSLNQAWEKTVSPAMQANEEGGMGKGAAFLKAIYDNKFSVGVLLGSAAYTAITLSGKLEGPMEAAQQYLSNTHFGFASEAMAADLTDSLPQVEADHLNLHEHLASSAPDNYVMADSGAPAVPHDAMFPDIAQPAPELDNYVMADNSAPVVPHEYAFPDVTDHQPDPDNYVMADNSAPPVVEAPPVTVESLGDEFREHIEGDKVSASVKDAMHRISSENPRVAAQAVKDMAYFMYNGIGGVDMDKEKAMDYFHKAAEMGNGQAIKDLAYIASLTDPSVENPYAVVHEHASRHASHIAETISRHAESYAGIEVSDHATGGVLLPEEYAVENLTNEESLQRSLDARDRLIELAQNGGSVEEMHALANDTYIRTEHFAEAREIANAAGRSDLSAAIGERIGADIGPQGADLIGENNDSAMEISAKGRDALVEAAKSGMNPDDAQHVIQQQGYIQNQDINKAMDAIRATGNHEFADKVGAYYGVKPENYQVNWQPSGSEVRDQFNESGFKVEPEKPTLASTGRIAKPDIYSY